MTRFRTFYLSGREVGLALIVIALLGLQHLHADYSGATPSACGLTRLSRDIVRRGSSCAVEPRSESTIHDRS